MESLDKAYGILLIGILIVLAVFVVLCLIRAVIGPRIADRILAANMMGTMVSVMIAILAFLLGEGYLVDICMIYAMISFLAVIVLTKVYMGVYAEKKQRDETLTDGQDVSENSRLGQESPGEEELQYDRV
ncbi:MAG: sodium:proton antiporter [Acetatifactor sp.]|nr:sodium:proton antiporter [Acetatifactor sp.]